MAVGVVLTLLSLLPYGIKANSVIYYNGNCSYYWILYNGTIPEDAFPAGNDSKNETFYIGLVYLKLINELFAGMIIPSTQSAKITSLGITRDVRNDPFTVIHILCSKDQDAFDWKQTKTEDLKNIDKQYLVGGGKVLGQDLYIGRVNIDGGMVLGKVFPHKFIYQGLYVPAKGVFAQFMEYEVLTFKCNKF